MGRLLALMLAAGLLTGCGAAGKSVMTAQDSASGATAEMNTAAPQERYESGGIAYNSAADAPASEEIAMDDAGEISTSQSAQAAQPQDTGNVTLLEEKLVYHCNLEIETLDYPATVASVKETVSRYGGIIQAESENDSGAGWYYEGYQKTSATMHNYLEVRIPSENYDSFLAEMDGVGKVISKSTSVDNISQRYYDTTSQIEALKIQEKNLLAMMEKCETIEDMIAVEQRLSDVQYELGNLQTSRRYMDMDVAYSYVNISITEVMEYRRDSEPIRRNTFIDRLKNTVKNSGRGFLYFLEGLLFLLIELVPYILVVLLLYIIFLRKKVKKFREKRKAKKAQKTAGMQAEEIQHIPDNTQVQQAPEDK